MYTKRKCSKKISAKRPKSLVYNTLLVCLSVRLYPINVKTAEPVGPKFCVEPQMTTGKVRLNA